MIDPGGLGSGRRQERARAVRFGPRDSGPSVSVAAAGKPQVSQGRTRRRSRVLRMSELQCTGVWEKHTAPAPGLL